MENILGFDLEEQNESIEHLRLLFNNKKKKKEKSFTYSSASPSLSPLSPSSSSPSLSPSFPPQKKEGETTNLGEEGKKKKILVDKYIEDSFFGHSFFFKEPFGYYKTENSKCVLMGVAANHLLKLFNKQPSLSKRFFHSFALKSAQILSFFLSNFNDNSYFISSLNHSNSLSPSPQLSHPPPLSHSHLLSSSSFNQSAKILGFILFNFY